ncbi:MAG TPA: penicillin-binding protein [Myxococcales bacterium]|nr:penicillin-binding protein [Myxococcales bacterium]
MGPAGSPVRWIRIRIALLAAGLFVALACLLARAARLQLGEGARLAALARAQYLSKVEIPAQRGDIHDRRGVALASSVQVDSIFVNAGELPAADVAPLAAALRLDPRALARKLASQEPFVWVARQVTAAQAEAVRRLAIPGVGSVKESRRFYPERELAAQLLGFTGIDGTGLEGLERKYDDELRGRAVLVPGTRDARGRVIAEDSVTAQELEGASIDLTIDRDIQYLAQQALDREVAASHSVAGIAIAMEPSTGAVLALAVSPSFNPNAVGERDRDAVRDRAVTDAYEPGSTFKAFMAAGAIQDKVATPGTVVFGENGAWTVNGRTIHDHKPFGWMSLARVLQVSSNIGAAKIGLTLGRERLRDYLEAFGFGERTEVGLPGEVHGTIGPFRSDVANATASFGQGVTATPMQLVTGYAALANGGVLMRPYVVSRIVHPGGPAEEFGPQEVRRAVSPAVAASVTRMLEGVVSKGGTAPSAAIPGYVVAGKTGTAQKVDPVVGGYSADKRFASFIGYVPAEAPRLVVGVFLDEPKGEIYGGEIAAPVFRDIAEGALRQLGVPPTRPLTAAAAPTADRSPASAAQVLSAPRAIVPDEAEGDAEETAPSHGPAVPSVVGLPARRAIRLLATAGLTASLAGEGRVVAQRPAAGAALPRDGSIHLQLADPASEGQP